MSTWQSNGLPQTINLPVGPEGCCVRLKQWSVSLILRADSPCTVYWSQKDFEADQNGLEFPGEAPAYECRIEASVFNLWLRGRGSQSNVTVTYIGRDGL